MQKKLIALAVAGLVSGAAFAQSNVTVYGVMDATWESYKTTDCTDVTGTGCSNIANHSRLASDSSYLGFKGSESLGNGLTAVFQFETGINADTGGWAGARDTMVALAGNFGTVAAGNLTGPVRALGAAVDFNPGASSAGFTGSMYGEVAGLKTGVDDRSPNTIAYISPTFSGLYGVAAYQNGTTTSDASSVHKDSHLWTLGLIYSNGPIFAGFGYIDANRPSVVGAVLGQAVAADSTRYSGTSGATNLATDLNGGLVPTAAQIAAAQSVLATEDSLKNYRLAGKYSFPFGLTISALWDNQKYNAGGLEVKRNAYMLGGNYGFGANNVWLQYAVAKDLTSNVCDVLSCGETGAKQLTLGYSYAFSKRTMTHAFYSRITNDKYVAYDNYVNGISNSTMGADSTVFGLGLRHTF